MMFFTWKVIYILLYLMCKLEFFPLWFHGTIPTDEVVLQGCSTACLTWSRDLCFKLTVLDTVFLSEVQGTGKFFPSLTIKFPSLPGER